MTKRSAQIILAPGTSGEQSFPFVDGIEVGRRAAPDGASTARIVIPDPVISSRHCAITQADNGRFFIRDLSLNGTKVDGKRLVPNLEFALLPGQTVQIGDHLLTLWASDPEEPTMSGTAEHTMLSTGLASVTVLVGDIRGYTTLSQVASSADVHRAVRNVFSELEAVVARHGGTLKEYQGDAIFAFWEEKPDAPGQHAIDACAAALALRSETLALAQDPSAWIFPDFPLEMDWALASGSVMISSLGRGRPTGLSMIGDAVNLAFRLEKLIEDRAPTIITCDRTYTRACERFDFTDFGAVTVKGRTGSEQVHVLLGPKLEPPSP
jgi:adenylate cyclase